MLAHRAINEEGNVGDVFIFREDCHANHVYNEIVMNYKRLLTL